MASSSSVIVQRVAVAPYVAGVLNIPPNTVYGLLLLIQGQLDLNCPGAAMELALSSDPANTGNIYIGAASPLGRALTTQNYGYMLGPGDVRIYQSSYPGGNALLGRLQIITNAQSFLHVEVQG